MHEYAMISKKIADVLLCSGNGDSVRRGCPKSCVHALTIRNSHQSTAFNMNLSFDNSAAPLPLVPQESLSYEDIASLELLRFTSSTFEELILDESEKMHTNDNIEPTKLDVLCGRDKVSYGHVGNRRFRVIISTRSAEYQNCTSRDQKTRITHEIIKGIRECGGRFLKINYKTGMYEDVGDEYAHEKVSHALRSAKDPARKKAPRKKRKVVRKPPTQQETKAFEFMFIEQQRIFQELVAEQQTIEDMSMRQGEWQENEGFIGV